ncbi:MAG: hypothetical protein JSW50_02120 [Candidatus Latescibacterota bacterium]|nr:MAG: hypothetical protein JSW50_02120 [Candidatus Latescibacterota bacterium]
MKKALLLTLVLVVSASMAFAQAGSVGLFADPGGVNCNVTDIPGLLPIFAVHVYHAGATACQFSAPVPACMIAAIWLSDTAVFPVTVGNSQTGVAIGYGLCQGAPTHVLTINVFAQGLSAPCCVYPVLPDPNVPSGQVEVVDCNNSLLQATGGVAIINSTPNCNCDVPTEDTTWGKVKSLYTN